MWQVACRKVWTKEQVDEFRDFAGAKYRANMRLDNLPGAELVVFRDQNGAEFVSYRLGYPIAEASDYNSSNFYINNHLRITIRCARARCLPRARAHAGPSVRQSARRHAQALPACRHARPRAGITMWSRRVATWTRSRSPGS